MTLNDDPVVRYHSQMREAKASELQAFKGSWAWRLLQRLRNWKYAFGARHRRSAIGGWRLARASRSPELPPTANRQPPTEIVCLPLIEWDFRFQRPQQLMLQFAKHGWRVSYVSAKAKTTTEKAPNVFEVPSSAIPRAALVIVQHPKWASIARQLGGRVIYDCMDDLSAFTTERHNDDERQLMAAADLVIVTSSTLEREARRHAKNVVVIRNGCDYEHFAKTPRAGGPRKVIGYYGAISDWFDVALVAELAQRRPEWDFLLIGSTWGANLLPFAELPNVTLPGEKPYGELPRWLGVMDVCIIPFRRVRLTEATNPVKVYEMLAAGKPVVSVPIAEVAALAPLVRLASSVDEFEREIVAAFGDEDAEARRAFAREQTWERRWEELRSAAGTPSHQ